MDLRNVVNTLNVKEHTQKKQDKLIKPDLCDDALAYQQNIFNKTYFCFVFNVLFAFSTMLGDY